jgi:hypothetical protein
MSWCNTSKTTIHVLSKKTFELITEKSIFSFDDIFFFYSSEIIHNGFGAKRREGKYRNQEYRIMEMSKMKFFCTINNTKDKKKYLVQSIMRKKSTGKK